MKKPIFSHSSIYALGAYNSTPAREHKQRTIFDEHFFSYGFFIFLSYALFCSQWNCKLNTEILNNNNTQDTGRLFSASSQNAVIYHMWTHLWHVGASVGAGEHISVLPLLFLSHQQTYQSTFLSGFHVYISIVDCDFLETIWYRYLINFLLPHLSYHWIYNIVQL